MKKLPTWLKILLIFIVVYLFAFQPIPYYLESPGQAFGLDQMVEIDEAYAENEGEFYLTTVGIRQATPMTALLSLHPFHSLISEQQLFGQVSDFDAYDTIQKYYMESSGNAAIQVAFEAANYPYELEFNGVYVLQILEQSDFAGELQVGDTVKAVDGQAFETSLDFINYVSQLKVGEEVEITYERSDEIFQATGKLTPLETGVAGIGIGLVDNTSLHSNPEVEIHSGGIGGPSAGLMFSLQIYNALIEEDLLGDYKIAGTGTIHLDGTVGRIGGIEKKIVAADEEKVDFFFAPDDEIPAEMKELNPKIQTNYQEAVAAADQIETDMKVIPVKTFEDAINFLEKLSSEKATRKLQELQLTNAVEPFGLHVAIN